MINIELLLFSCISFAYSFQVSGTVEGLHGEVLSLTLYPIRETIFVQDTSSFHFDSNLNPDSPFTVAIKHQPQGRHCTVNQRAHVARSTVKDIQVFCTAINVHPSFSPSTTSFPRSFSPSSSPHVFLTQDELPKNGGSRRESPAVHFHGFTFIHDHSSLQLTIYFLSLWFFLCILWTIPYCNPCAKKMEYDKMKWTDEDVNDWLNRLAISEYSYTVGNLQKEKSARVFALEQEIEEIEETFSHLIRRIQNRKREQMYNLMRKAKAKRQKLSPNPSNQQEPIVFDASSQNNRGNYLKERLLPRARLPSPPSTHESPYHDPVARDYSPLYSNPPISNTPPLPNPSNSSARDFPNPSDSRAMQKYSTPSPARVTPRTYSPSPVISNPRLASRQSPHSSIGSSHTLNRRPTPSPARAYVRATPSPARMIRVTPSPGRRNPEVYESPIVITNPPPSHSSVGSNRSTPIIDHSGGSDIETMTTMTMKSQDPRDYFTGPVGPIKRARANKRSTIRLDILSV